MITNAQTILCLDLGAKTGWAIHGTDRHIISGVMNFHPRYFEVGGMYYLRFRRCLSEIKQTVGSINAVYFEEVRRHNGTDTAHIYSDLLAILTAWCEHHKIPYEGISVSTIKKATTGKGNASKVKMIKAMYAKGHAPKDDNEADALAILYLIKEGGTYVQ
ncbi:crossover junction endodeoxyribonuclease RuvC [Bartonella sp. B1099]|uniref:crossover junction endodeoxyribonuclease RuvC n=1 Tax=Bartonella sp. B1099 TaxID=2911422 RepID=UPI0020C3B22F|nr:hypothetical protein [Bartonella sp. B1099]